MKNSTALRQSREGVWISGLTAVVLWGIYAWFRSWPLAIIAGFTSLFFLGDVFNVLYIKQNLKKDPDCLKKKIPGT